MVEVCRRPHTGHERQMGPQNATLPILIKDFSQGRIPATGSSHSVYNDKRCNHWKEHTVRSSVPSGTVTREHPGVEASRRPCILSQETHNPFPDL